MLRQDLTSSVRKAYFADPRLRGERLPCNLEVEEWKIGRMEDWQRETATVGPNLRVGRKQGSHRVTRLRGIAALQVYNGVPGQERP
jgi:hypothetical protein